MTSTSQLDSYFPVVASTNKNFLGNQYYQTVALRESDFWIMQKQNPLGWEYFSKSNVNYLLQAAAKIRGGQVNFSDIVDHMSHAFEVYVGKDFVPANRIRSLVEQLNNEFIKAFSAETIRKQRGIIEYNRFLGQPFTPGPLPSYERQDRTLVMGARNQLL